MNAKRLEEIVGTTLFNGAEQALRVYKLPPVYIRFNFVGESLVIDVMSRSRTAWKDCWLPLAILLEMKEQSLSDHIHWVAFSLVLGCLHKYREGCKPVLPLSWYKKESAQWLCS